MQTKKYHREYMKKWRDNRRLEAIKLLGGFCIKCGTQDKLEFDHIDPKLKNYTIANIFTNRKKFELELKKCQLLCKKCHWKKTLTQQGWRDSKSEHGTSRSYRFCKCNICKKAHNDAINEYRWRTGMRKKRI